MTTKTSIELTNAHTYLRFVMASADLAIANGDMISDAQSEELTDALRKLFLRAYKYGERYAERPQLGEYGGKPIGRISSIDPDGAGFHYALQTVRVDDFTSWEVVRYDEKHDMLNMRVVVYG